jgi:FAD dependent oxidoreductase TIGR03364
MRQGHYDLAVIGAGICGLAHALAAARRGKKVAVIDRDAQANGASVRNFGFVTVTGQQRGICWQRARRSRDIWLEVADAAGIEVVQRGLVVAARRKEAAAVLEAFLTTEMGEACELLAPAEAKVRFPALNGVAAALYSPHEIRIESRTAIPRLAAWLADALGVTFLRGVSAQFVSPPEIDTSRGVIMADAAIVCPGDDLVSLFPERLQPHDLTRCKLHMMRLAPIGARLDSAVMSDLGLVRYLGYAELPAAEALRSVLLDEQPDHLANGVHLIVVRSSDGTLVVGDSHHYAPTPDPFAPESVDDLILDEFRAVLGAGEIKVTERWTGTYASAADRLALIDRPSDAVRLVLITSGTGASTSFAIAEEVIADLYG